MTLEQKRSKETEIMIKKEESRVKDIELELTQKIMKEEVLRKIIEAKEKIVEDS